MFGLVLDCTLGFFSQLNYFVLGNPYRSLKLMFKKYNFKQKFYFFLGFLRIVYTHFLKFLLFFFETEYQYVVVMPDLGLTS